MMLIDSYFNSIVHALKVSDADAIPRILPKRLKSFWTPNLKKLKQISIDLHNLWKCIGCPRNNSLINCERIKAKYVYKLAIRDAKILEAKSKSEQINSSLADKNPSAFWKCWNFNYNKNNNNSIPPIIDNLSDPSQIANSFKSYYSSIFVNSSLNREAVSEYIDLSLNQPSSNNIPSPIDIQEIESAVKRLSLNKATDPDGLTSEHIVNSHPSILTHFKALFSCILNHSYVPKSFTSGIITPIIKDKRGDLTSTCNYRPITISSVVSKIFEYFLLNKFSSFLGSDSLQFGYKPSTGCHHAIFLLRRVIQYFNDKASNVYIASVDASKAFDRVNHFKLFSILIKQGLPKYFVNTLINWYSRISVRVKWSNSLSAELRVLSGVRQGGVLSGILFNLYVNNILTSLRKSDLGCHIKNLYVGCIMYADDLILLSASLLDLQNMLQICDSIGKDLGMKFNASKSKCLLIGPNIALTPSPLVLENFQLPWVSGLDYLGICLCNAKTFQVDLSVTRRKFFTAMYSILSKCNYTSEMVKLKLLEAHCLPILLYATESLNLPQSQIAELNSLWNSAYRRIFHYHKWESVKQLICLSGRLDLHRIINLKSLSSIIKMSTCNATPSTLKDYLLNSFSVSKECTALFKKYDCYGLWSIPSVKLKIFTDFRMFCSDSVSVLG